MEERPVAEVLDEVGIVGEGEQAVPLGTLAAHLGDADGVTSAVRVERRHDVAPDTHTDQDVVAGPGGTIVRTSRTEVRGPGQQGRGTDSELIGSIQLLQMVAGGFGESVPDYGGQNTGGQIAGHRGVLGNQRTPL